MESQRKIKILVELGNYFDAVGNSDARQHILNKDLLCHIEKFEAVRQKAFQENHWFTIESINLSFIAWAKTLNEENIRKWLGSYSINEANKNVGVIMAGNIPLVGLHDALCVLISGHKLRAKLSSKDTTLILHVLEAISIIEPSWKSQIEITSTLKGIDYLIATGSDNSARYFEYYFKDVKKIIRKNRTSVAVVTEVDTTESLDGLADDVFTYYGLGCRNVTKVFVPVGFDLDKLFGAFFKYQEVGNHNKYANNYDYNKAIYLLNKIELIENGFLLLKEDEGLHSPVGVLFYEFYENREALSLKLNLLKEEIQCKVSSIEEADFIPYGKAQQPELWDYSDGVDTIEFLN